MAALSNRHFQLLQEAIREWNKNNPQKNLSFLVTGKTGVGKSRLVNALIGEHRAEEGQQRDCCTNTATPYKVTKEGIDVLVWDSPGLQDGDPEYCDWFLETLKSIYSKDGLDVIIYCLRMDDRKFYIEDKTAIRKLTEGLGKEIWKKTVIALTFANKIDDPDEGDNQMYFQKEFTEWERQLRGVPKGILNCELGIDSGVCMALPIVPVGNYAGDPKRPRPLPTGDNWLAELWISCYSVMSDVAGLALYQISKYRLTFPADVLGDIPLNEKQQSAFWNRMRESIKRVAPKVASMGGGEVLTADSLRQRLIKPGDWCQVGGSSEIL